MAEVHPSRVGHRLAAIVAADVVGYSRLMGLDEEGTARILREHRTVTDALVAKHGGRIVRTTGDGMLVEFASVVDAVRNQENNRRRRTGCARVRRRPCGNGPCQAARKLLCTPK
jgi:class 3 adenylate cyclase